MLKDVARLGVDVAAEDKDGQVGAVRLDGLQDVDSRRPGMLMSRSTASIVWAGSPRISIASRPLHALMTL
jgi:hypothetical protein